MLWKFWEISRIVMQMRCFEVEVVRNGTKLGTLLCGNRYLAFNVKLSQFPLPAHNPSI